VWLSCNSCYRAYTRKDNSTFERIETIPVYSHRQFARFRRSRNKTADKTARSRNLDCDRSIAFTKLKARDDGRWTEPIHLRMDGIRKHRSQRRNSTTVLGQHSDDREQRYPICAVPSFGIDTCTPRGITVPRDAIVARRYARQSMCTTSMWRIFRGMWNPERKINSSSGILPSGINST